MWNGELTDIFFEDVFSLVCCKHKDKEKDIPDKEKIRSMLKEAFILVRMKTLYFMIDCDDKAPQLLEDLALFKDKFHPTLDEKVKHKDELILIESVCTFTLSLYAKVCLICTPVKNLEDLRKFRDSYDVQHFISKDKKQMPGYINSATKQFNHYKKVRECFDKYDTKFVDFAFAASCFNFFHYFANESAGALDEMHSVEGLAHYKIMGNEAYKSGEYDRAFRLYLEGLQVAPFSYQLFGNCAQACLKLENYEAAELFSRFALIMQPEYCKAYYKLASALVSQDQIEKACDIASFGLRQCINSDCQDCIALRNYEDYLRNFYDKALEEKITKAIKEAEKKPSNTSDSDDDEMPALTDDDDDDDYTSGSSQEDLDDLSIEEPVLLEEVEQNKPVIAEGNQNFESANELNETTIEQEIQNVKSSNKLNELAIEQEEILYNEAINELNEVAIEQEIQNAESIYQKNETWIKQEIQNIEPADELNETVIEHDFQNIESADKHSEKETSEVSIVNTPSPPRLDKVDTVSSSVAQKDAVCELESITVLEEGETEMTPTVLLATENSYPTDTTLVLPARDDVKESNVKENVQVDLPARDMKESGVSENVLLDLLAGDDIKESAVSENVQLDLLAGDNITESGVSENVQLDVPAGDDVKELGVKENVQLELPTGDDVKESDVKENVKLDLSLGGEAKESVVKENIQSDTLPTETFKNSCEDPESKIEIMEGIEETLIKKCKLSENDKIKQRKFFETLVEMEAFMKKVEKGLSEEQQADVLVAKFQSSVGNSHSELPESHSSSVNQKPKAEISEVALSQDPSNVVKLESSVGNTNSDLPENQLPTANQKPKAEDPEMCFDYAAVSKFENALVEGSSALKMGLMSMAMLHFKQALAMLNQLPELARHAKMDPMILKFACGYASFKCNSAENLNIAIENFKDVIQNYPNPLAQAYYFLGLAYSKQNQFQAALPYLETVDSMPESTYNFEAYDLFDEKALKLFSYHTIQASLKDEITRCTHPPMPEAICRYENCLDDPAIYTSGISFKKFMCIRCQQRCILQYHIPCWKSIKEARGKTDKEFLDTSCFTPDCNGLIVRVEMIGKDGVIERDFTSEENYKPKKSTKQRKTKLEKKCEQKERKKQTRVRQMSENREISVDDIEQEAEIKNADEPKFDPEPKAESHSHNVSKKTSAISLSEDKKQAPELPVNAEPLYVIKKDTDSKEPENKQTKHKEKKKPKKSTVSIDEFCEGMQPGVVNCNDYQLRLHKLQESKRVIEEAPSFELPPVVSQKCVTEVPNATSFCTAEKVPESRNVIHDPELADFSDDYDSQLREAIYVHFENFLDVHGFIKLTDPRLKEEIENLAPEMKNLIELEGGFVPFIQKPYKLFAIVHNNLCLFRDMMNVYNARNIDQLDDFNQGYQPESMYDSLSLIDDDTCIDRLSLLDDDRQINLFTENKENDASKELLPVDQNIEAIPMINTSGEVFLTSNNESKVGFSPLNPNAKEYNPSLGSGSSESHPCAPGSSEDSCSIQSSIDTSRGEETSLLSRVNGMKQELTSYSLDCDKDNLPSLADTSSESLLQEESLSFHSDAVDKNENENVDSHNLCVDSIHKHFLTLLNNENRDTIHKSYQDLRFLIRQLEKMIQAKSDASVQAGVSEADMISCGVMKEDEEFVQMKSELEHLSDSVEKLQEEKSDVEERLTEALDKQMELQNKYQVETSMLKKEIEENKVTTEDANKSLKKKCTTLEKDVKQWRQKYELAVEKEKELNTENERLKVKVKSLTSKVVELEKEFTNFKSEQEIKKREYDVILREYEDQFKNDTEEKYKEIKEIQEQLRDTELDILNLKRTEYEKSFQKYSADANAKIQDLRSGIQQLKSSAGDPTTISALKALLDKVGSYIEDMHAKRSIFYTRVVEQINKVKGGTSLKSMPNLEMPTFSPMPTVETVLESLFMPTQQSTQNNSILPSLQQAPAVQFPAQVYPQNSSQNVLPASQNSSSGGLNHMNMTMNPAYYRQEPAMQNFMLYMTPPYGNESTNFANLNSVPAVAKAAPSASPMLSPMGVPSQLQGHDIWHTNSVIPSAARTLSTDNTSVTAAPPGYTLVRPKPEVASASGLNQILPSSSSIDEINQPGQRERRTSSVCSLDDLSSPVIKSDPRPDSGVIGNKRASSIVSSISNIPVQSSNLEIKTPPVPVGPGGDSASNLELGYSGISRPSSTTGSIVENSSVIGIPSGVAAAAAKISAERANLPSGYSKVLVSLKAEFPHMSDRELMLFIKQYREQKGRLSYMPVAIIFAGVKELITQSRNQSVPKVVRPKALVNKPLVSSSVPPPPPSSKSSTSTVAPWAKSDEKPSQNWTGELSDNTCSVCLEEMNPLSSYKVDCGHFFHLKCIKQWLNMESNCPICRVHLLLPEDFPRLS